MCWPPATTALVVAFACHAAATVLAYGSAADVPRPRGKRYLAFPEGSNFVVTGSYIKALLQVQPQGWTVLQECDLPFALPSDTKVFKALKAGKRHRIERRYVHDQLKMALQRYGTLMRICLMPWEVSGFRIAKSES